MTLSVRLLGIPGSNPRSQPTTQPKKRKRVLSTKATTRSSQRSSSGRSRAVASRIRTIMETSSRRNNFILTFQASTPSRANLSLKKSGASNNKLIKSSSRGNSALSRALTLSSTNSETQLRKLSFEGVTQSKSAPSTRGQSQPPTQTIPSFTTLHQCSTNSSRIASMLSSGKKKCTKSTSLMKTRISTKRTGDTTADLICSKEVSGKHLRHLHSTLSRFGTTVNL